MFAEHAYSLRLFPDNRYPQGIRPTMGPDDWIVTREITLREWIRLCVAINPSRHMRLELTICLREQGYL